MLSGRGALIRMGAMILVLAAGGADLGEARESERTGDIRRLEARLEAQDSDLSRAVEEIRAVGVRLEEKQARVDEIRARARELRAQTRDLRSQVSQQRLRLAEERARYRERVRAAYQGRDLDGISFLLERLIGGSGGLGDTFDARVLEALLDGGEVLTEYEDRRRMVEGTLHQVSQKRRAYRELLRKETVLLDELEAQERELRRAVRRLGDQRARTVDRLRSIRAAERARMAERTANNKTPAASSAGTGPAPRRISPREAERASGTPSPPVDRERELEIARQEIVATPVESLPEEEYMALYRRAAAQYGFARDWYVLAAVGKIESDHGREMGPSVSGAMGPMQFLPSTWETSGVDGNGDGVANIMDPEDAIPAAASYLVSGGAPEDWHAALYSYNRADWYVLEVLAVAEGYRRLAGDDGAGPYL